VALSFSASVIDIHLTLSDCAWAENCDNRSIPITINGKTYKTGNHLYLALKLSDYPKIQEQVRLAKTTQEARKLVNLHRDKWAFDWSHRRKTDIMHLVIAIRLSQHPDLVKLLEATKRQEIVYLSRNVYWGTRKRKAKLAGDNHYGRSLRYFLFTRNSLYHPLDGKINGKAIKPLPISWSKKK
jgi:predicted NAD-dependent protein-ADP-ribosyltransferase YbiA (DUF1768 family)